MKTVQLIALNARYSHSNPVLFYLKRILNQSGEFRGDILELTLKESPADLLEKILISRKESPQAICFSVYIWNSRLIRELVLILKQLRPEIPLILGGPEVAYNMDYWLRETEADYLVQGPGETVILPILRGDITSRAVKSAAVNLNDIPFPYDQEDLKQLENRMVYYETSRGCPFGCTYCLSSCEGQEQQYRDLDKVKKELRILAYSGARVIKLVDRSFNADAKRAREIWRFLKELKDPCSFHFEIYPLFLEEEDFQLLAEIPETLFHFEVGIQSTSPEELKAVKRAGPWPKVESSVRRLINETSISIHLDQIVGLPGADPESVRHSFNQILSLQPEEFQMGFLKILPGTELQQTHGEFLIHSQEPPYEVLQTPRLSFKEMRFFHRIEELLNSYFNSGLFRHSLALLISCEPFATEPFLLFEALLDQLKGQGRVKPMQWAKLAEIMWETFGIPLMNEDILCENSALVRKASGKTLSALQLKDTLRQDWAPLSQGQYLPAFLNYDDVEQLKRWRRKLWPSCQSQGITSSDYKRGILIYLESETEQDLLVSVPLQKGRREFRFSSSNL